MFARTGADQQPGGGGQDQTWKRQHHEAGLPAEPELSHQQRGDDHRARGRPDPARAATMPCTDVRVARGNQERVILFRTGYAPAWVKPKMARTPNSRQKPHHQAGPPAASDQTRMIALRMARGPNRSPARPPGIWPSA